MIKRFAKRLIRWTVPSYDRRLSEREASQHIALKDKVRMRTDDELKMQAQGLKEIRDILNKLGIPYFLSGGTLLGTIRENNFIRWDWDVGIDVKVEDIYPVQDEFISAVKKADFTITTHYRKKTNFKINAMKYGVRYEILGYLKVGDMRYRKASYYPNAFVEDVSEVQLHGERYSTFAVPKQYLEWFYGDWKTPRHTAKISDYVTRSSRTSPYRRILTFIKSIVS